MIEKIATYFILFMMYSFMGWLMEVMLTLIKEHKFVNRGFLIGPYCPIYGYGCLLIIILLGKYANDFIVLFLMTITICSILEYLTSYFMEKLFNARWWDYSNRKFNLNGRICLETMIPFGLLGSIVVYVVNPFYMKILSYIPLTVLYIISIILLTIYLVDNIISFNVINSFKKEIKKAEKDRTEEITKKIRNIISKKSLLHKRLINAFPRIKTSKEVLYDLQAKINERIAKWKTKDSNK